MEQKEESSTVDVQNVDKDNIKIKLDNIIKAINDKFSD